MAWEEREHVLGSESAIGLGRDVPIGVIRERPMLALLETCMMMNERRGFWVVLGSCRVPEKRALLGGKCDDVRVGSAFETAWSGLSLVGWRRE